MWQAARHAVAGVVVCIVCQSEVASSSPVLQLLCCCFASSLLVVVFTEAALGCRREARAGHYCSRFQKEKPLRSTALAASSMLTSMLQGQICQLEPGRKVCDWLRSKLASSPSFRRQPATFDQLPIFGKYFLQSELSCSGLGTTSCPVLWQH